MEDKDIELYTLGATFAVGIANCFLQDRENERQVYYRELDYLNSRAQEKTELKREKIELKKEKIKKRIKEIESEDFRYELQIKQQAFEKALAAEERIQTKKLKAQERIAIKKLEYLEGLRQTVNNFYVPLISVLTEKYNDLDTECGDSDITQNERFQLQHMRDNVDTQLTQTRENFNQCIKNLTDTIEKIQINEIDSKGLYLSNSFK